jgi:very-short-patch-repair endonuclease
VRRALSRCAEGCVASHLSAALLHGFATYHQPPQVRLTRSTGQRRAGRTRISVAPLPAGDVVEISGLPVTSRARTVADVARTEDFVSGLVTVDSAIARGVRRSSILDCLDLMRRWPGTEQARATVLASDGRSESALESVVRGRIIRLGLPVPQTQAWISDDVGVVGRVDLLWSGPRVIGEADGRVKYRENELWQEKVRQERLEDAGFIVLRWTWAQAHAPDDAFRRRVLNALARGEARAS